jgi:hypothetical protein
MALNQAYTKPPESAYGHSSLVPYGGDGVWYAASAVWQMKKIKRLSATKNKMAFDFALISRISVQKNHITDLMMEGDFVITSDAFIPNEKKAIDDYKDAHREQWGESEIYEAETGEMLDS